MPDLEGEGEKLNIEHSCACSNFRINRNSGGMEHRRAKKGKYKNNRLKEIFSSLQQTLEEASRPIGTSPGPTSIHLSDFHATLGIR